MKLKKLLINIVCAAVAVSFAGCTRESASKSDIDELKQIILDLQEQTKAQGDKIDELQEQIKKQDETLFALAVRMSSFCSLEEAYANKRLNENDIMHISYYRTGKVLKFNSEEDLKDPSKWEKVDFVPEVITPIIDADTERLIKTAYYYKHLEMFQDSQGNFRYGKDILKMEYLGCYNGNYVLRMDSDGWGYGAEEWVVCFDGIVWIETAPKIIVFSLEP